MNSHRAGIRSQLGPMSLEDGLRLRCLPPIESPEVNEFLKDSLLPLWKDLGGHLARGLTESVSNKEYTVLPTGNSRGQETAKALFKKRERSKQFKPLLLEH